MRTVLAVMPLCVGVGCAHMAEKQAITAFTTALEHEDYQTLKVHTSEDFNTRALRTAQAMEDIQILRVPTGEVSVVEVQEESPEEKLVAVTNGKSSKKVYYRLKKSEASEAWVVDDVYLRQNKGGVKVDKSVAEQMDLLLSVRDFLDTWHEGQRDQVLSVVTMDLAETLRELPEDHLNRLTNQVVAEHGTSKSFRPKAQLDDDVAIVSLPRPTGKMLLKMKLIDGRWKVADVAVESRKDKEHIESLKKTAMAMQSVTRFLTAYAEQDREKLAKVCHSKLYEDCLALADLSQEKLPSSTLDGAEYYVKMEGRQADYIIEQPNRVVRLSLSRGGVELQEIPEDSPYIVEEVTLYETGGVNDQVAEKRLSVVFTGQAILSLFQEAVRDGDLPMIRNLVTADFNERVWRMVPNDDVSQLAPQLFSNPVDRIVGTQFDGAVSRFTVSQGGLDLTYVLVDHRGRVRVDDVKFENGDQIVSMKETMEILLPIRTYASALAAGDTDTLQRYSSSDLNRLVWTQAENVPKAGQAVISHLGCPLADIREVGTDSMMVVLGDENFGAKVMLVDEHGHRLVDDIIVVNGKQPEERAFHKRVLRTEIAYHASQDTLPSRQKMEPVSPLPTDMGSTPQVLTAEQTEPAQALPTGPIPMQPTSEPDWPSASPIQPASFEEFSPVDVTEPLMETLPAGAVPLPPMNDELPSMSFQPAEPTIPSVPKQSEPGVTETATPQANLQVIPDDDAFASPPGLE